MKPVAAIHFLFFLFRLSHMTYQNKNKKKNKLRSDYTNSKKFSTRPSLAVCENFQMLKLQKTL